MRGADEIQDWHRVELDSEEKSPPPAPLPPIVPRLPLRQIDYTNLQEQFRVLLRKTKAAGSALASLGDDCWDPVLQSALDHIQLFTLRDDVLRPRDVGMLATMRARGSVLGRAERLAYAARDTNAATRLKWDGQLRTIEEHQSFPALRAKYCVARVPMPSTALLSVEDRVVGGLLAFHRHKPSQMYCVYFCSAMNPDVFAAPPSGTRLADVSLSLFITQTTPERCDVDLYLDVRQAPTGSWLTTPAKARLHESLRLWVHMLEEAVQEWPRYYGKA